MRTPRTLSALVRISALLLIAPLTAVAADEEFLPTPYTAEQIRDEWQPGLELTHRDTTPDGQAWSRTLVKEWSESSVVFAAQRLDENLEPVGEERTGSATWAELRDHARFPASRASRSRQTRTTPLGELDGWLYEVREEDGGSSEFFFADAYPGPPVVYSKSLDGNTVYRSELIARW